MLPLKFNPVLRLDLFTYGVQIQKYLTLSQSDALIQDLIQAKIHFKIVRVLNINSLSGCLDFDDGSSGSYDLIFNVAGPGSLKLLQKDSLLYDDLELLPIAGQYARFTSNIALNTNIYPVPDPNLPFLGVHLTPSISGAPIVGPNAIPWFNDYVQGYDASDATMLLVRAGILSALFCTNTSNFRIHSLRELTINMSRKFRINALRFFDPSFHSEIKIMMDHSLTGIRPQLINKKTLQFCDDFICFKNSRCVHVVNAVSPAFSSAFAIAKYALSRSGLTDLF